MPTYAVYHHLLRFIAERIVNWAHLHTSAKLFLPVKSTNEHILNIKYSNEKLCNKLWFLYTKSNVYLINGHYPIDLRIEGLQSNVL
jgi:hypothetical protein